MELRLRDMNGGDVGTVEVDEVPDAESVLFTDGRYFVRNQRNEGQWREVTAVKLKAAPKADAPVKPEGDLPPVTAPKKANDGD
jgi:hypothetical protein